MQIARMLRTDEQVRERWNFAHFFDNCGVTGCALGWAKERGIFRLDDFGDYVRSFAAAADISNDDVRYLFTCIELYDPEAADTGSSQAFAAVAPDRVATAIEHYLAHGGHFEPGYVVP